MKKYTFWAVIVCFVISLQQVVPVYACSGYGQIAIGELVKLADVAVVGQFVELDSLRMNGIFQVTSYLMGQAGPEYLLLALNSPIQIERGVQLRHLSGECPTTAGMFNTSDTIVVFLRQRSDGAYERLSIQSGLYVFPDETAHVDVFLYYPKSYEEFPFRTFTFDNLVKYIAVTSGWNAQPPLADRPYPLTAPIGITTEAGTEYLLPVDGSPPHLVMDDERAAFDRDRQGCTQSACVAYSPNGLDQAKLSAEPDEDGVITMLIGLMEFSGDALLFSPTNDSLAVWADGWIHIHALYYPLIGNTKYHNPEPVNRIRVGDYEDVIGAGVWSPDGRMLAYGDDEGLWLWDVFTLDTPPQLVLAAHEGVIPRARYFSPMGRYLAIEDGESRYHIDLVTGNHFGDGLISPDDRTLLAFDTRMEGEPELAVQWLASHVTPYNPFAGRRYSNPQWLNAVSLLIVECGDGYFSGDGEPWVDDPWCAVIRRDVLGYGGPMADGFAFDYDRAADKLVTIVEGTTITIDGEERDLAPYLDSAIAEIKWLPSLYYH